MKAPALCHRAMFPTYWTGKTGKALRKAGKDALYVGAYLVTCPNSNPLGLYYLPLPTLCHETGLTIEDATAALTRIAETEFAFFDPELELIWVPEMARFQLGRTLHPRDKRIPWIMRMLEGYAGTAFGLAFWQKYHEAFQLPQLSADDPRGEAPSKPLRCPIEGTTVSVSVPVLVSESVSESDSEKKKEKKKSAAADTPPEVTIERVVMVWNEIPGVKPTPVGKIPLDLRKRITQRIGEHKSWAWWESLFQLVRHSKFLTGQKAGADGFHASLWWILGPRNLAKTLMGEYTDFHHTEGAMPNGTLAPSKLEDWANDWESGPDLSRHPGSAVPDASTH
jgi:hypothetical protein